MTFAAAILIAGLLPGLGSSAGATEPGGLDCDPLEAAHCLLPFPNDAFTVPTPAPIRAAGSRSPNRACP